MVGNSAFSISCKCVLPGLFLSIIFALIFVCIGNTALIAGTIYYHKDKDGVMHFTDTPSSKEYEPMYSFGSGKQANREKILKLIKKYSRLYGIDSNLVRAVLQVESSFNCRAVSSAGAQGLMQIMPETQEKLQLFDPFDAEANIEAGVRYLSRMLNRFSSIKQALAAYNAGPSKVEECGGLPPYPETRNYVQKVLDIYKKLKQ